MIRNHTVKRHSCDEKTLQLSLFLTTYDVRSFALYALNVILHYIKDVFWTFF